MQTGEIDSRNEKVPRRGNYQNQAGIECVKKQPLYSVGTSDAVLSTTISNICNAKSDACPIPSTNTPGTTKWSNPISADMEIIQS